MNIDLETQSSTSCSENEFENLTTGNVRLGNR